MRRQLKCLPFIHINVIKYAHIARFAHDKLGKLRQNALLAIGAAIKKTGDKVWHRHTHAAHLFGQRFNQQLQFFTQHTRHQPFQSRSCQAVEYGERNGEGNAIEWVIRFKTVSELKFAIIGVPVGRKLVFGDVGCGMLH